MSKKKKLAIKIFATIIISSILTVVLQIVSNSIFEHTKQGLIIGGVVYESLFLLIVADIMNVIDKNNEGYYKEYHAASAIFECSLLLICFLSILIIENILIHQSFYVMVWLILLVISIIFSVLAWKNLTQKV